MNLHPAALRCGRGADEKIIVLSPAVNFATYCVLQGSGWEVFNHLDCGGQHRACYIVCGTFVSLNGPISATKSDSIS